MPIATGVAKQLRYKLESNWGAAPGTGSAQLLRRVSSDLALRKQTYESGELNSHYQRVDFRHGVRSVEGAINGELSAGTWKDFFAAAVRRAFTTVSAITGASITVAGVGPTYTLTRGAGSWLTDGIKAGQVVRLTAGSFNAANLNKNLLVLAVTSATVLTVMPLNGVALVAEGPVASSTLTVPGKVTFAPATGHTDQSFAIEHWHADVALSELFLGCKVNELSIGLPPTGMGTIGLQFLGKDMTTAGSAYYVTPTAETTTGILAAVNGLLVAQGGAIALVTGLNLTLRGNMSAEPVVGSNVYADIAEGRITVDGQATALFESATLRDYFLNETEVSLVAALSASPAANADFLSFALPRVKFGGAAKDDGDKALVQTLPFTALYNHAGGTGQGTEQTTLYVQDSQA
jgi:hypothetical protein